MQTLTAEQETQRTNTFNDIVYVAHIEFGGNTGTKYYSNRTITIDGNVYEPILEVPFGDGQKYVDTGFGGSVVGSSRVLGLLQEDTYNFSLLIEEPGVVGVTLKFGSIFKTPANTYVEADILFEPTYIIDDYVISQTMTQLKMLDILTYKGESLPAIGRLIDATNYTKAPVESYGKMVPIIFGSVKKSTLIPIDIGAKTNLDGSLYQTEKTVSVDDVSKFPTSGTIRINNEWIKYNAVSTTANTFGTASSPVTRGYINDRGEDTADVNHNDGEVVYQVQDSYYYAVADHKCKALEALYADNTIINTNDYTVYSQNIAEKPVTFVALNRIPEKVELSDSTSTKLLNGSEDLVTELSDLGLINGSLLWNYGALNSTQASTGGNQWADAVDADTTTSIAGLNETYPIFNVVFNGVLDAGDDLYGEIEKVRIFINWFTSKSWSTRTHPFFYLISGGDDPGHQSDNYPLFRPESEDFNVLSASHSHNHDIDQQVSSLELSVNNSTAATINDVGFKNFQGVRGTSINLWYDSYDKVLDDSAQTYNQVYSLANRSGAKTIMQDDAYNAKFGFDSNDADETAMVNEITSDIWMNSATISNNNKLYPLNSKISYSIFLNATSSITGSTWRISLGMNSIWGSDMFPFYYNSDNKLYDTTGEFVDVDEIMTSPYSLTKDIAEYQLSEKDVLTGNIEIDVYDATTKSSWSDGLVDSSGAAWGCYLLLKGSISYTKTSPDITLSFSQNNEGGVQASDVESSSSSSWVLQKKNITDFINTYGGWNCFNGIQIVVNSGGLSDSDDGNEEVYILDTGLEIEYKPKTTKLSLEDINADVKGIDSVGDGSGTLITNPEGVITHLLTDSNFMGLDSGVIDTTTFNAFESARSTYAYARRIGEQTTLKELLNSACFEAYGKLSMDGNKIYLKSDKSLFQASDSVFSITTNHILGAISKDMKATDTIVNQLMLNYNYNNYLNTNEDTYADNNLGSQEVYGLRSAGYELQWFQNETNQATVADISSKLLEKHGNKWMYAAVQAPLILSHLQRMDVCKITDAYESLNTYGQIISTLRLDHKSIQVILEINQQRQEVYTYDDNNYIYVTSSGQEMVFVLGGVIVAVLSTRALKLKGQVSETPTLAGTFNNDPVEYQSNAFYFKGYDGLAKIRINSSGDISIIGNGVKETGYNQIVFGANVMNGDYITNLSTANEYIWFSLSNDFTQATNLTDIPMYYNGGNNYAITISGLNIKEYSI